MIELQPFDSEVFGVPYYRLRPMDSGANVVALNDALRAFPIDLSHIMDAKISADAKEADQILQKHHFRKVSTQVTFLWQPPVGVKLEAPKEVEVNRGGEVSFSDETLRQHGANFCFSRFALDALVPREKANLLYYLWARNSLRNPHYFVAHHQESFISFKKLGDSLVIDLTSVLQMRQGLGTLLLQAVLASCEKMGCSKVFVGTEIENVPACELYRKAGFSFWTFHSCFHRVILK